MLFAIYKVNTELSIYNLPHVLLSIVLYTVTSALSYIRKKKKKRDGRKRPYFADRTSLLKISFVYSLQSTKDPNTKLRIHPKPLHLIYHILSNFILGVI